MPAADNIILQRRKEEDQRNDMISRIQYYNYTDMKASFEHRGNVKVLQTQIRRKYKTYEQQEEQKLEERREKYQIEYEELVTFRLRRLFEKDDEEYREALSSLEETNEQRLEKMRQRAAALRAKREEERRLYAEEKILEKMRNDCDELRSVQSKAFERYVAQERAAQLVEKQMAQLKVNEEKKYYDQLWEEDRLKKVQREEKERQAKQERDRKTRAVLDEQMQELRVRAEETARLKQEEAQLMKQELALREMDEQRKAWEREQEQRRICAELDRFNAAKIAKKAKEVRDALEMDLKIIDEINRLSEEERLDNFKRKQQMQKEMQTYREHLYQQKRREEDRQRELDQYYRQETERQWQVRAERWNAEQRARDKLMAEVIATRQEQIKQKKLENQQRQEELRKEREAIQRAIEQAREDERLEREELHAYHQEYQNKLASQIDDVRHRKAEEVKEVERLNQIQREQQMRYDKWVEEELANSQWKPKYPQTECPLFKIM